MTERQDRMNRDELAEHMLSDPYHSNNRKMWIRELHKKGWYENWTTRTLKKGTLLMKQMHEADHSHPDHDHD